MWKKFDQIGIGEQFYFHFDKQSLWRYKKISQFRVECIYSPATETEQIGKIYDYKCPETWCKIMVD